MQKEQCDAPSFKKLISYTQIAQLIWCIFEYSQWLSTAQRAQGQLIPATAVAGKECPKVQVVV